MGSPWLVFLCGTLAFMFLWTIALAIISSILKKNVPKQKEREEYQSMATWLVTIAIILMYTMWFCCVVHQLYPLIVPELTKHIEEEMKEAERYK